ncbi:GAT domain-containing protein [Plasmodiophora brassicae]
MDSATWLSDVWLVKLKGDLRQACDLIDTADAGTLDEVHRRILLCLLEVDQEPIVDCLLALNDQTQMALQQLAAGQRRPADRRHLLDKVDRLRIDPPPMLALSPPPPPAPVPTTTSVADDPLDADFHAIASRGTASMAAQQQRPSSNDVDDAFAAIASGDDVRLLFDSDPAPRPR